MHMGTDVTSSVGEHPWLGCLDLASTPCMLGFGETVWRQTNPCPGDQISGKFSGIIGGKATIRSNPGNALTPCLPGHSKSLADTLP